jgi:squalene-hopene/tetraprenyl-beta-curcumene cyclase
MNTMELVHFASRRERAAQRSSPPTTPPFPAELIQPARHAILCARQYLLGEQRSDGSWVGIQHSDVSLASQLVFLLTFLGCQESELVEQAAATILDEQLPDGGWSLVPGGPPDVSTSVQAYFALKLASNDCVVDGRLGRACELIRSLGGADAADLTTRFFLALFGQVEYELCPAACAKPLSVAPHKDTAAAMAVIWTRRPLCRVSAERGVRELFIKSPADWERFPPGSERPGAQSGLGLIARLGERLGYAPWRARALRRAESRVRRELDEKRIDGLGFSELVWQSIAMRALGISMASAGRRRCEERLREMVAFDADLDTARPQIRHQPASDTIATLRSLASSGMTAAHPCISAALKWLSHERRLLGKHAPPDLAGLLELLSIEQHHESELKEGLPPDIGPFRRRVSSHRNRQRDDRALRIERLIASVIERLLQAQQLDGGWPMPSRASTPDVTGAVLEALALHSGDAICQAVRRAVDYLRGTQRPDGSWISASGAAYTHSTSLAVRGLLAAGISPYEETVAAGINWLLVHQQPSGGWGELPPTQHAHTSAGAAEFVSANATASQTAWALLALVAAGRANSAAARRGVEFLLDSQDDGRWYETQFVLRDAGCGRWYRCELHSTAAPLTALSRWAVEAAATSEDRDFTLRLVRAETEP